jgi:hypothetical protein
MLDHAIRAKRKNARQPNDHRAKERLKEAGAIAG